MTDVTAPFVASVVCFARAALCTLAVGQRQTGTFRGDDADRGRRVVPADALRSLLVDSDVTADEPLLDRWEDVSSHAAAALLDRLALDDAERLVVILTSALEIEPCLGPMVACLTDAPSLRHATVTLLDAMGRAVGCDRHAVRRALQPDGRLAALRLVTLSPGISDSFGDRVVLPDEWLVDAVVHDGAASRPRHRLLRWVEGKPGGSGRSAGEPRLCCDPDVLADAAAWAADDQLPAFAVVAVDGGAVACRDSGSYSDGVLGVGLGGSAAGDDGDWDRDPLVVAVARQCLAEGAGLIVRTPARARSTRASAEALAELGVPVAIHDPHAGAFPVPEGWRRPIAPGRASRLGRGDPDIAWADLSLLASPLATGAGWSDLVLDRRTERHLREVAAAIANHSTVVDTWGFGGRPGATGLSVLFNGPSGTGKTLACRVLAAAVGLDLWMVDLARVTDKYLGESEKRLDRVLTAAAGSGAMLLFDEAEAMFGRRAETREARDRWANLEVSYLLQRIEQHPGVTVLTTNLGQQLDQAFDRRIAHRVEFTRPDAALRRRLWRQMVPPQAPLHDAGDLALVADRFELSGGMIRNAALNAAYAAAGDPGCRVIRLEHLVRASVRELAKSGQALTRAELGPWAALIDSDPVAAIS